MTRVLVLSAAAVGAGPLEQLLTVLGTERADLDVDVLSGTAGGAPEVVVLDPGGAAESARRRIQARLGGNGLARMLVRLTTLDGGHGFARRLRSDDTAQELARRADLVIALDRDAQLAAWQIGRRGTPAVVGAASGMVALRSIGRPDDSR
jgi:hypothetical protein